MHSSTGVLYNELCVQHWLSWAALCLPLAWGVEHTTCSTVVMAQWCAWVGTPSADVFHLQRCLEEAGVGTMPHKTAQFEAP